MYPRSAAILLASTLAALGHVGAAEAASLTELNPCYVSVDAKSRESVGVGGTGFTPGAAVDISVGGKVAAAGVLVDDTGELPEQDVPAPYRRKGQGSFQVVAAERGNPANTVTLTSRVSALDVTINPRRARPSQGVRFTGSGFTLDRRVYAHYVYRGKVRRTVSFSPRGVCGDFSSRKRQIPLENPGTGTWTVQFDQQRAYTKNPSSVFVRLKIAVSAR